MGKDKAEMLRTKEWGRKGWLMLQIR
jgi:hypothetical protein